MSEIQREATPAFALGFSLERLGIEMPTEALIQHVDHHEITHYMNGRSIADIMPESKLILEAKE